MRRPERAPTRRVYSGSMLVSERIGQLFVETDTGRDRLEFTEYGAGDAWVALLPAELMARRMPPPPAGAPAPPDAAAARPRPGRRGPARGHPRPARSRPLRPSGRPAGLLRDG